MDGKFLRCWGPTRAGRAKGGLRAASGARLGTPEGEKELGTGGTRGRSFKRIFPSTSMVLNTKKVEDQTRNLKKHSVFNGFAFGPQRFSF